MLLNESTVLNSPENRYESHEKKIREIIKSAVYLSIDSNIYTVGF